MPWWWPFKKREAARADLEFRESLDQALLRQDDLLAATEKLRMSRKRDRRSPEESPPQEKPTPRGRDAKE